VCVCFYTHIHTHTHAHMYTRTHTHTHTHTYSTNPVLCGCLVEGYHSLKEVHVQVQSLLRAAKAVLREKTWVGEEGGGEGEGEGG